MRYLLALSLFCFAGCHVHAGQWGGCKARRSLNESIDVSGASSAKIVASAGDLRVSGDAGQTRLEVSAEACAVDEAALDEMELLVERRGDQLYVETVMASSDRWKGNRRMDLVVVLPESLSVEVVDRSGDLRVEDVAAAKIDDSSGDLVVDDVQGDLEIKDSSGDVRVDEVAGDVRVDDRSGDVRITDVGGSVTVRDRSGDVIVRDVAGDLTVAEDGSGSVDHSDVRGRVRLDD